MADQDSVGDESTGNFVTNFITELMSSPLNIALLLLCAFLLYKIISGQKKHEPASKKEPDLPKMKQQDMTLEQLREYDGKGPEGRILLAANGKIFDVTRGKRFYGPGNFFITEYHYVISLGLKIRSWISKNKILKKITIIKITTYNGIDVYLLQKIFL